MQVFSGPYPNRDGAYILIGVWFSISQNYKVCKPVKFSLGERCASFIMKVLMIEFLACIYSQSFTLFVKAVAGNLYFN